MTSKRQLFAKYEFETAAAIVDAAGRYALVPYLESGYDDILESRTALTRLVLDNFYEIERVDAFCYGFADEASPAQKRRLSRVLRSLGNSEEAISAAWQDNDFTLLRCF